MKTQHQLYRQAAQQNADINTVFLEMVQHPTAPLTSVELAALIKKRPALWGRFSNWVDKLTGRDNG